MQVGAWVRNLPYSASAARELLPLLGVGDADEFRGLVVAAAGRQAAGVEDLEQQVARDGVGLVLSYAAAIQDDLVSVHVSPVGQTG